jgi:toxin FitB
VREMKLNDVVRGPFNAIYAECRSQQSNRVLPFDVAAARIAGALSDRARSKSRSPAFPDLAIAATEAAHGLTVLTGNLRHFVPLNVPVHSPLASLPTD